MTARVILRNKADAETKKLIETFTAKKGCDSVEYVIDPAILGGLIIEIGDRIFDGSLRTELKEVKRKL